MVTLYSYGLGFFIFMFGNKCINFNGCCLPEKNAAASYIDHGATSVTRRTRFEDKYTLACQSVSTDWRGKEIGMTDSIPALKVATRTHQRAQVYALRVRQLL